MKMILTKISENEMEREGINRRARKKILFCIQELNNSLRDLIFAISYFVPVPIREYCALMTNGHEL